MLKVYYEEYGGWRKHNWRIIMINVCLNMIKINSLDRWEKHLAFINENF